MIALRGRSSGRSQETRCDIVAARCGLHQRGGAVIVTGIGVCASRQKQLDNPWVLVGSSLHQRSPSNSVWSIYVSTGVKKLSNCRDVAALHGFDKLVSAARHA